MALVRYNRSTPHILPDGRTLSPGSVVEVDENDPSIAPLLADGRLVGADREPTRKELLDRASELEIEGRTKMSTPVLKEAITDAEAGARDGDNDDKEGNS